METSPADNAATRFDKVTFAHPAEWPRRSASPEADRPNRPGTSPPGTWTRP